MHISTAARPAPGALTLLIIAIVAPTAGAVTLVLPSSHTVGVGLHPCPSHANHVCWVRLRPMTARLMPAGGSVWFTSTFDGENPTWTRQSGTLNGTYTVQTYDAYNECPLGGAEFRVFYAAGAGDPASIQWTQGILTNKKLGGRFGVIASYMDIKDPPGSGVWGPPYYPYQYVDSRFYDKPSRHCPASGWLFWIGECYATTTPATKTMKIYEGIEWGFTYNCFGRKPLIATRVGTTSGTADYASTDHTLSLSIPINVLSTTGSLAVDPEWTADPLSNGFALATGMELVLQQDDVLLFAGGELTIMDQFEMPVLRADIAAVHVDDAMMDEHGFNMMVMFGDIEELSHGPGQFLTDQYFTTLDMEDQFVPFMTVTTEHPFSQRVAADMDASSPAVTINGFQIAEEDDDFGDGNGDLYVDSADLVLWTGCRSGPEARVAGDCRWADADADLDVDLTDFAAFQRGFGATPPVHDLGACCPPDGLCVQTSEFRCHNVLGGTHRGPGTECDDLSTPCEPPVPGPIVVNEVWADDPGADTNEFVELFGPPGLELIGLSLIVVDGDTGGQIESPDYRHVTFRADLSDFVLNADGFFVLGTGPDVEPVVDVEMDLVFGNGNGVADELQNGSQTYALVPTELIEYCIEPGVPDPYCTGNPNQLTQMSVGAIAMGGLFDAVATRDSLLDEVYFFAPLVLGSDFFEFDTASRVPNGVDTNSPIDWQTASGHEMGEPGDTSTPGMPN